MLNGCESSMMVCEYMIGEWDRNRFITIKKSRLFDRHST